MAENQRAQARFEVGQIYLQNVDETVDAASDYWEPLYERGRDLLNTILRSPTTTSFATTDKATAVVIDNQTLIEIEKYLGE